MAKTLGHKYIPPPPITKPFAYEYASSTSAPREPKSTQLYSPTWTEAPTAPFFAAPVARMSACQMGIPINPAIQISRFTPFINSTPKRNFFGGRSSPLPAEPKKPIGEDHYSDWYALSEAEDEIHPYVRAEESRRAKAENNIDPFLRAGGGQRSEIMNETQPHSTMNEYQRPGNGIHPYPRTNVYQNPNQPHPYPQANMYQRQYFGPPRVEMVNRVPWKKARSSVRKASVEDFEAHMAKVVKEKTGRKEKRKAAAFQENSEDDSMGESTISPTEENATFPVDWDSQAQSEGSILRPNRDFNHTIVPKTPVDNNLPTIPEPGKPKKKVRFFLGKALSPPTQETRFTEQEDWETLFNPTMHSPKNEGQLELGQETFEEDFQQVGVSSPVQRKRAATAVDYWDGLEASQAEMADDDAPKVVQTVKKRTLRPRGKRGNTSG